MSDDTDDTVGATCNPSEQCDMATWKERWASRRKMAWAAFVAMCASTVMIFYSVPLDKLDKLDDVIIWFYGTMTTIILGYMGTTVSAHIFDRRQGRSS